MHENNRKQMNDVIVSQRDVVRRVAVTEQCGPSSNEEDRFENNPFFEKLQNKKSEARKVKSNGSKGILWSLVFVVFLAGGFVVANYFATAIVEITPVMRKASIDTDFVATKDSTDGTLVFQLATSTEEKSKEVDATVEKKILVKASGTIVIYNSYSTATQRLVPNTRFESPDHKIFRISKPVVVPGMKVVDGKTVPGSVEAVVYADVAGKEYNIGTSNFTIPGFKGDPRYSKFSAISKPTSPITGGFSGSVKVPTDEVVAQTREELKQDLKIVVVEKARADIPENMTFFPGSMVVKFEEVPQDYSGENAAKVTVRATVSVFFFDTALLTQMLADEVLPDDKGKVFSISNMSTLTFTFLELVDNVVLADISKLSFHIAGEPVFAGEIDTNKIRTELAGKSKKDFTSMMASQNNIRGFTLTLRPAWNMILPSDASRITVKVLTK